MGSGLSREIGTRIVDMFLYPLVTLTKRYATPLSLRASQAVASGNLGPAQREQVLLQTQASYNEGTRGEHALNR